MSGVDGHNIAESAELSQLVGTQDMAKELALDFYVMSALIRIVLVISYLAGKRLGEKKPFTSPLPEVNYTG